jgi:DNA-binding XRE family transcriptional regulator
MSIGIVIMSNDPRKKRAYMLQRLGEQLRAARESEGFTQQEVADLFGWGRDAISKLESGTLNVSLADYLLLVHFLRDHLPPGYPAVVLHDIAASPRNRS